MRSARLALAAALYAARVDPRAAAVPAQERCAGMALAGHVVIKVNNLSRTIT
jgi:hypothetical protein